MLEQLCLPKTSSRSTSHRINNIPVDLLWWVADFDEISGAIRSLVDAGGSATLDLE